ncbi:DegT/DnrJ/EryC1/StrS family aminotransferase [Butyrivibrio sp. VCB2001]|uniref:DegT/DnrJ/EryC1/StrS family aminotransferase n=1 Tax=Butyrivibrio sp. VCB2001 TaxID=1280667 RepID=UPI00042A5ED0|nr:DegT/DnrJ/EryC1/StrS family aminotransferase [Butyrivibrio sp. VCB2001]
MEFRSLKKQYAANKEQIDAAIARVINDANFISGSQVKELEEKLADYVGVKHCITCANGTDALSLALMTWEIGEGDAVFVPDFTFFSSGEVVSFAGATPIFVDVEYDTCNIDPDKLEIAIKSVLEDGTLKPKVIVAVDLFGQPADYPRIREVADKYNLLILEDGAQGFGGAIGEKKACSFGDISTTSFFPMKPLGCYGDGGAVFTDNDEWADLIRSYCVHGKGTMKYDNVRIGMNSRLDTMQAAILLAKFDVFINAEINEVNAIVDLYTELLSKKQDYRIKLPFIRKGFTSSWAQYTIKLSGKKERDDLQKQLKLNDVPSFVYYPKAMHEQQAFKYLNGKNRIFDCSVTNELCNEVLSLPLSPYMEQGEVARVVELILGFWV